MRTHHERVRDDLVLYLRERYLGPVAGPDEIRSSAPEYNYLVGVLYPQLPPSPEARAAAAPGKDAPLGEDEPLADDLDQPIELANAWRPASAAISFLLDGTRIACSVRAGTYARTDIQDPAGAARQDVAPELTHEGASPATPGPTATGLRGGVRPRWAREPREVTELMFAADDPRERRIETIFDGRARIVTVWRRVGERHLVTVAVENVAVHDAGEGRPRTEDCLFQVDLECRASDGQVLPYRTVDDLSDDPEDEELRLLYRDRLMYGVGHGCSVRWSHEPDGSVTTVGTDMLPSTKVPAVRAVELELAILSLQRLGDATLATGTLCDELAVFIDRYETWVNCRRKLALDLAPEHAGAATRLLSRMDRASERMRKGVDLLRTDPATLTAFRIANCAMRLQVLHSRLKKTAPGHRGQALPALTGSEREPTWYPFQLGFQLLSLPSTTDPDHPDRKIIDLIWFPTGGGKTEAYLGLAAFEMIRRRLTRGIRGGGTAVLTRYTLRLLTTQQFQRAGTLICALELLRRDHPDLRDSPGFSIGLWVGGETTPNTFKDAHALTTKLKTAVEPQSPFQVQDCPWCGTRIVPIRKSESDAYGIEATAHTFRLHCPHPDCAFHDELPVAVVDEQIYQNPPTLVVATVDKFARLPWIEKAGVLLGRGNVPFDPPSLIIQDELHLLSGPLGTTVAVYEAALQAVLSWDGRGPKVVASTATIRSADDQVKALFSGDVALFPPSGLDADDSFFAVTDRTAPGRLYLGLMPQAFSPSSATILTCAAILQAPRALRLPDDDLDFYWTVVAYHNSLRELGRTLTNVRDDVSTMMLARRRDDPEARTLTRDGIVELTGSVKPSQLERLLTRLETSVNHKGAVDLVATTNMLSVGIDIGRLGVMVMNGQPKTTAEYIQATSRVGRDTVPGLVVTLFRSSKPRDRSHYEGFRSYHESLYRYVEPTSVTPWSTASRDRSLKAALVLLVRHGVGLRANDAASQFRADDPGVARAVDHLLTCVSKSDREEHTATREDLLSLVNTWQDRAESCAADGRRLVYDSPTSPALLKNFGEKGEGWPVMNSMRSVDRQVRVVAVGEDL